MYDINRKCQPTPHLDYSKADKTQVFLECLFDEDKNVDCHKLDKILF